MLESTIKLAVCKIKCGTESGSGWLIKQNIVLTAYHCVENAINDGNPIELEFNFSGSSEDFSAEIIDYDEDLDIALLSLEKVVEHESIPFSDALPMEGKEFYSYGWPVDKLEIGHKLTGSILQILSSLKLGNDIEINIDPSNSLSDYSGHSGAPLICDGICIGIIRYSIENTIGAISIFRIRKFLIKNNIFEEELIDKGLETPKLAPRTEFNESFDNFVISNRGKYIFLEGAHGIGKSTFCMTYKTRNPSIEYFNTYSFTHNRDIINVAHLAQPVEFVNWLNMQVSMLVNGSTGVASKDEYSKLIQQTQNVIQVLGRYYSSIDKIGVLFIDGLDEVEKQDRELLKKFLGLLPQVIPSSLVIILSAPSYRQYSELLGAKLRQESCIALPSLSYETTQRFCVATLAEERCDPEIIKLICDKAEGHPLYLRYLIDLVNNGKSDDIVELPLLEGNILNYYESLWHQLSSDTDGVNLLAIMVRLRWGIPISLLVTILNSNEQTVLVSTIERIQHLLLSSEQTNIYHSSFSEFLKEKTHLRENDIQLRLFKFCENNLDIEYGLFNIIYHGLKSLNSDKSLVISYCNQEWADKCVLRGIKPDTLLGDIGDVIKAVTNLGDFTETNRILLLSQRMKFRYDILFAQSADLTANALISLNKNNEVLQHIIRYKQLIIPIDLALKISLKLIETKNYKEARALLKIIEFTINKEIDLLLRDGYLNDSFFILIDLQQQQYILKKQVLNKDGELYDFQLYWLEFISTNIEDKHTSRTLQKLISTSLQANLMCLEKRLVPLETLKRMFPNPLTVITQQYIYAVCEYNNKCVFFDIPYDQNLLSDFFKDLNTLIIENEGTLEKFDLRVIDYLISLGTPPNIMTSIEVKDTDIEFHKTDLIADDNVSLNETTFIEAMAQWRTQTYLNPEVPRPTILSLLESDWMDGLFSLTKVLAWSDGLARRFNDENDLEKLDSIWNVIHQDIFQNLKFSLSERVDWKDAYTLPESILPHIYKHLTSLIIDVFPQHLGHFLNLIDDRFSYQCGIYSEGFRLILNNVIHEITNYELEEDIEDQVFNLVEKWEIYVTSNLKNRRELVPELLRIIPLYERLNALEKSQDTYKSVLAFSMGPNWYKEDQLGLAVSTLEAINIKTPLNEEALIKIAALLEASSGEMTFERFVRYAKRDFIKALCLRGEFDKAIRYYIRQTYGSLEQMYADITKGEIDRLSELEATRFPGTALDEQDSILCIIQSAIPHLDWQLCWVILETFQFGDSRHLANYAEVYGILLQNNQEDPSSIEQMFNRLEIICESEVSDKERYEFLSSLKKCLPENLNDRFINLCNQYIEELDPSILEMEKIVLPQTIVKKNEDSESDASNKDFLFSPGLFGTSQSIEQAENLFTNARRFIRRKNYVEAQKEIVSALKSIQQGEWSIWEGLISEMKEGQSLLKQIPNTNSDLIKLFSPLILNEQYSNHYRISENLIKWLTSDAPLNEQHRLLELSIEHIQLMVGMPQKDIDEYSFLAESNEYAISIVFRKLIVHVIDHPTWLRSEKAAEMLLWLLRNYPEYIPLFGPLAFTNDPNNHPDVIGGILDQLSFSKSNVWNLLSPTLDFESIKKACKHIGRLSILKNLLNKAIRNGDENAGELLDQLNANIDEVGDPIDNNMLECPSWARILKSKWSQLEDLGIVNDSFVQHATLIMREICAPITLETSYKIETLLSDGYYSNKKDPLRWKAKVSYALQTALQSKAPINLHEQIVEIFRQYNPTQLDHLRIKNFKSHGLSWLESSQPRPQQGEDIYLDYYESFCYEGHLRQVRLTAYLGNVPQRTISSGRFSSINDPTRAKTLHIDTCANVDPALSYFGVFTPAIPTSNFMQVLGVDPKSIKRAWWRSSRSDGIARGAPKSEGCYLSIKKDQLLKLPNNMNIFWIVEINQRPVGMIFYQ